MVDWIEAPDLLEKLTKDEEGWTRCTPAWRLEMSSAWRSADNQYRVYRRDYESKNGPAIHISIFKEGGGDVPWAIKQDAKDKFIGENRTAVEVYPASKNLVDKGDVYHLWSLPEEFQLPFNLKDLDSE